ncbi:MAG: hypothetical protein WA688_09545 [Thermoplasmata archaeon]
MSSSSPGPEKFVLAPSGTCWHHCKGRTRPHAIANARGPIGWVYACPRGAVSTVTFLGVSRRPSPARVRRYLQSRTERSERVRPRDLRAATRHGPELGPAAERWASGPGSGTPIRLLYWRRYPRKVRHGYSYLYACFEHGAGEVRFYPASSSRRVGRCPFCATEV